MVADRISLIYLWKSLQIVEENNGKIDSILIHRTSHYGVKSVPRFNSLIELKDFIKEIYKYKHPNNCDCQTKNEGIYTLLSFSFKKDTDNTVFINNLESGFQSSKLDQINSKTFKRLEELNEQIEYLEKLFDNYVCFPYIEFGYIECEYIEIIRNSSYYEMIELYKKTKEN